MVSTNKKHLSAISVDCLDQIKASVSRLSISEKKLADFILTNPHLLRDYSSLQLARAAELSQSSVVKFSQNLGYAGFTDLKLAINESVLRNNAEDYRQEKIQHKTSDNYQHLFDGSSRGHLGKTQPHTVRKPLASNLDRIEKSLDTLSANERKLAKFLLQNAALIRDYSSQQVASATRVSQSSVVKFSQKMGYRGFTDLKMAMHESVVRQGIGGSKPALSEPDQASIEAFAALINAKLAAMQRTDAINDFEQITSVAKRLNKCNNVQIYSPHSGLVVDRLSRRLTASGKPVLVLKQSSDLIRLLDAGQPNVVVFIFDKQGTDIMRLAQQAIKSATTAVLITDHQYNVCQRNALTNTVGRVLFYTSDNLSEFTREFTDASIAHLIDMVCSRLH